MNGTLSYEVLSLPIELEWPLGVDRIDEKVGPDSRTLQVSANDTSIVAIGRCKCGRYSDMTLAVSKPESMMLLASADMLIEAIEWYKCGWYNERVHGEVNVVG